MNPARATIAHEVAMRWPLAHARVMSTLTMPAVVSA